MNVKTRFEVGDTAYWLEFKQARCEECKQFRADAGRWIDCVGTVHNIIIRTEGDVVPISYGFGWEPAPPGFGGPAVGGEIRVNEKNLYESREEAERAARIANGEDE